MIFLASDHAGLELKNSLVEYLKKNRELEDLGTFSAESTDYPDYAARCCEKVLSRKGSFGILICGTGIGMSIAANKFKGIRAAAVSEELSARMAREHNHCQILCMGARVISVEKAVECVEAFLGATPDNGERHLRRIEKIHQLEKNL